MIKGVRRFSRTSRSGDINLSDTERVHTCTYMYTLEGVRVEQVVLSGFFLFRYLYSLLWDILIRSDVEF